MLWYWPWPIEEVFGRPLFTLALAFLWPIVMGQVLAFLLLPRALTDEPDANRVASFRRACFVLGIAQLYAAYLIGSESLGPALAPTEGMRDAFGALAAVLAFIGGGIGRLAEHRMPSKTPLEVPRTRDVVMLRLRMAAYVGGPFIVMALARTIPLLDTHGVRWWAVALVTTLIMLGLMYGGLITGVLTMSLRRPDARVRALAERAAQREGFRLWSVWMLPTKSTGFANAAAIPWARSMIVTERITQLLDDEELDAVLAHEAGHLSEPPWVWVMRLGAAFVGVTLFSIAMPLALAYGAADDELLLFIALSALVILVVLLLVRRLARRMEERADAHAKQHVGGIPLGRALEKIHTAARVPVVTGKKRVHPDLYDRLAACGIEQGERPAPPNARAGLLTAIVVIIMGCAGAWLAMDLTHILPADVSTTGHTAAWRRLHIDPWDDRAVLALAWNARRQEDLERAEAYRQQAIALGVEEYLALELRAELQATSGDCDAARATFDQALASRVADPLEAVMELGGYTVPPALITECGMGQSPSYGDW